MWIDILKRYKQFRAAMPTDVSWITMGQQLLLDVREAGRYLDDDVDREYCAQIARDIGKRLFEITGEYFSIRLMPFEPCSDEAASGASPHPPRGARSNPPTRSE